MGRGRSSVPRERPQGNHLDLRLPASSTETIHSCRLTRPHLWWWSQLPQETLPEATKATLSHTGWRGAPSLLLIPRGFSAVMLSAPHSTHVESSEQHLAEWHIRGQEDVPT